MVRKLKHVNKSISNVSSVFVNFENILKRRHQKSIQTKKNQDVSSDSILEKINFTQKHIVKNRSCALLSTQSKESTWNGFLNLKEKWSIISLHINLIPPTHLVQWQKMTSSSTKNIQKFARWCLIYSLSKATNFQTWKLKKTHTAFCVTIKKLKSIILIISNQLWTDMNKNMTLHWKL